LTLLLLLLPFNLTAQDWALLHGVCGLRTFLAAQVAVPGQGVVGVLCLGSRCAGAFGEASWGLLLAMVATGLVPLLGSPWLGGLSALAAGLADMASMDGFTGFAAGFLAGAGALLGGVTNRHLGVRLGLLGDAGEELLLLLQPSEGKAIQRSSGMLVDTEASSAAASAADDTLSLFGGCESLPPFSSSRMLSAGTLLLKAAASRQQCFVPDVQALLDQMVDPPADLAVACDDAVGSMVVVPLFDAEGAVVGGLYLAHEEAGGFLKDHVFARQAAAVLQGLMRQEFAVMPHWSELLVSTFGAGITADGGRSCWWYSTMTGYLLYTCTC
jgi:hypothetical protein